MTGPAGILVVDKPAGWTSHDVVGKTRNLLKVKVGHTGTLDPMATGVLVLLVGNATKLAPLFGDDRKRYRAEVTFGTATDTYDRTGAVIAIGDPSAVSMDTLTGALDRFRGEFEQVPPMYAAVKIGGRKLYDMARRGVTVERSARRVTVHRLEADLAGYPVIVLDIECSKGTYVRSIAHDLGMAAGCPAHLSGLRRTAAGGYTLDDALDFSAVAACNDAGAILAHLLPAPESGQA